MNITYKDITINYEYYENDSKINLVYLHGWGQNIEMMMPIAKPFIKRHNVLIIDLPGFGKSEEPKETWTIFDYVEMLNYILNDLKIKNPIIIGHSFGGKVALAYGTKHKTNKLVLLASPYRKKIQKESLKLKTLKTLKKVPGLNKLENIAKKYIGSTDYKNASEKMRNILVKHVNLDLTEELEKIKCPTLLIWGTEDSAVPYEDALYLEQKISNCGLVTYEGCTHYAYLERANQTINVLRSFIGDEN